MDSVFGSITLHVCYFFCIIRKLMPNVKSFMSNDDCMDGRVDDVGRYKGLSKMSCDR